MKKTLNFEVTGREVVYGELLIDDRGGRKKLLAAYERIHQAVMVPHREAVASVCDRDLHGRGVGWSNVNLWRPLLWNACICGRPTHVCPR